MSVTLQRFGKKRRRVLLFAWLTLLPYWTDLPVNSQARDILVSPSILFPALFVFEKRKGPSFCFLAIPAQNAKQFAGTARPPTRMSEFKHSKQLHAAGARFRTGGLLGKSRFYSDRSACSQVRFRRDAATARFYGFRIVFTKACDHNFAGFACCTDTVSKTLSQLFD